VKGRHQRFRLAHTLHRPQSVVGTAGQGLEAHVRYHCAARSLRMSTTTTPMVWSWPTRPPVACWNQVPQASLGSLNGSVS